MHVTQTFQDPVLDHGLPVLREVGGAGSSLNVDGLAADVACLQVSFARLAEAADRLVGERGGVGLYRSQDFVHVDLRGERVRWP